MDGRKVLSIEEFRKIKEELRKKIEEYTSEQEKKELSREEIEQEEMKFIKEIYSPQIKILSSYDLSAIPAEEWGDIYLIYDENYPLDLSNTKANLDFAILEGYLEKYNFKGCNIKNIDQISRIATIDFNAFDDKIIQENYEIFLDDTYPLDFRIKYSSKKLTIKDYIELSDDLKEKLPPNRFENLSYEEKNIIKHLGITKAIEFYNIAKNYDDDVQLFQFCINTWVDGRSYSDEFIKKIQTAEVNEIEEIINDTIRKNIINSPKIYIDNYPKSFIEKNPDLFLNVPGVSNELREKYYNGSLTSDDILDNIEIFKNLLSPNLFISNATLYRFLTKYPEDILDLCTNHVSLFKRIASGQLISNLTLIQEKNLEEALEKAFQNLIEKKRTYEADIIDYYIQYHHDHDKGDYTNLSLYEIITQKRSDRSEKENKILDSIIETFGLDNILKMEEETKLFTSDISDKRSLYILELFGIIAKDIYGTNLLKYYDKKRYEHFEEVFTKVLKLVNNRQWPLTLNYQNIKGQYRNKHPELFISKEELEGLNDLEKEIIIEKFYNGKLQLDDIKKYPSLISVLKDKDLSFIFRDYTSNGYFDDIYKYRLEMYEKLGGEKFLKLASIYGQNLSEAFTTTEFDINKDNNFEDIFKVIDKRIYLRILRGNKYNEDLPESFKNTYPFLFLPKEAPAELKQKFYNKELTIKDFENNPDLLKYFTHTEITCSFKNMEKLIGLINSSEYQISDNIKKLKIAADFEKIIETSESIKNDYIDYIKKHWETMNFDDETLKNLRMIITRISYSNSGKLVRIKDKIVPQILNSINPIESLNQIEHLYLTNNLPDVAKTFEVFRILHKDKNGNLIINTSSISSPVLLKHSNNVNEFIIFSDFLKSTIESNNRPLQEYLINIKKGDDLFQLILSGSKSISQLKESERETLKTYSKMLNALYNQTSAGKQVDEHILSGDIEKDIQECIALFTHNGKIDSNLPDRLVKMFAYFAGIETYDQINKYIKYNTMLANKRNQERSKQPFVLEKGDIIKGLNDVRYLPNTLQNGANASELLGDSATAKGDATPLDTDISRILYVYPTISETIKQTVAGGYGPIWIVIKNDNEKLYYTRSEDETLTQETKFIPNKLEVFKTGVRGRDHYGIRTGFGSTNIDYIIVEYPNTDIEVDIALNGFYIPIVDKKTGEIIYTYEDYEKIRNKIAGLSHYGCEEYEFSHELIIPEIEELKNNLKENENLVQQKLKAIEKAFAESIKHIECQDPKDNYSLEVKTKLDGDIQSGILEIIDIGSTGRNTGDPTDSDFDYAIRVDNEIMKNPEKLQALKKALAQGIGQEVGSVFHYDDVKIEGIEEPVKIEADFYPKRDTITYTTDMAIKDRLDTLKELDQEKYEYVLANIVYAKQVLKEAECYYKGGHGKCKKAGLGGVGVENWILQNGGSFVEASRTFLEAAKKEGGGFIPFEEFKKKYRVWSFGENYRQKETDYYRHEEFVSHNMHADGYQAMCKTLTKFIEKVDGRKQIEEMFTAQKNISNTTQVSSTQK